MRENEMTSLTQIWMITTLLLSIHCDGSVVEAFVMPSRIGSTRTLVQRTPSSKLTLERIQQTQHHLKRRRSTAVFSQLLDQDESDSPMDKGEDSEKQAAVDSKLSSINTKANSDATESMSTAQLMAAIGTSPRRIVLSFLSASTIALGANFLGITSHLLEALPDSAVEATGLDTFYPRGDYKRFRSDEGYAFIFPKEWVADTGLEVAKAQLRSKNLDLTMKKIKRGILPDAAFGPPGRLNDRGVSSGDTNVSVIVSTVMKGFSLRGTLGEPNAAAEQLLQTSLAPPNSGRTATLLDAVEDVSRGVYQFEYEVNRGERGPPLRAISVIAEQHGDTLLTMTVVAPKMDWENVKYQDKLRTIAKSFHLLSNN